MYTHTYAHINTHTYQHTRAHTLTHTHTRQATAQLRSVLFAEEKVGAAEGGYVIDLRNNMGGVFQEALKMASLFFPDPKVGK